MESQKIKVLDQGYVQLVETWGSDERIIEAARMSTQKGFEGWGPKEDGKPGDEKLLAYLWNNNHATPFEMAGMIIEVQAPIFAIREWQRHRTQGYNEASARYAPLPALDYMPTVERCIRSVGHLTKQAASTGKAPLTREQASAWLTKLDAYYDATEALYQEGLDIGIPKEIARCAMSVARYSKMRATANLRNWLAFLTLRCDSKAQWEIQEYARAVGALIAEAFPRSYGLWLTSFEKGQAR